MYTVKDPIPLFKHVNFILNSTDREAAGLRYIKRFVKLLLSAGNSLTAAGYGITAVAHRGLRVEGNFSLQRKCETAKTMFAKMTLAGFTSVSIDPGVAGQFGDRLFFHFPNVRGVRIGCLSCFPAEQEILVLPPAVFCVEESHHLDGKITVVLNHAQQESASYLLTTPCNTNGDEQLLENYKENLYGLLQQVGCGNNQAWQELLQAATERNIALAQAMVSVCFSASWVYAVTKVGEMATKFAEQSLQWLTTESQRQCHFALTFHAALTIHGTIKNQTPIQAIEQLRWAANNNNFAEAQFYLVVAYGREFGLKRCMTEEIRYLKMSANQTHALGQVELGHCYHNGIGVEKDVVMAVRLYRLAAEQNHAKAQCILGLCYEDGMGVEKDVVEAVRFYRLAADQNLAGAQFNLGICYEIGFGVEKDMGEAVELFRLAAEQNFARAQRRLGIFYEIGRGVEKDVVEAVRFYRLAADQNLAAAQCSLGVSCCEGTGLMMNVIEGVRWFRLAAAQNYPAAQNNLGFCYEKGVGVERNVVEAVNWYRWPQRRIQRKHGVYLLFCTLGLRCCERR